MESRVCRASRLARALSGAAGVERRLHGARRDHAGEALVLTCGTVVARRAFEREARRIVVLGLGTMATADATPLLTRAIGF